MISGELKSSGISGVNIKGEGQQAIMTWNLIATHTEKDKNIKKYH